MKKLQSKSDDTLGGFWVRRDASEQQETQCMMKIHRHNTEFDILFRGSPLLFLSHRIRSFGVRYQGSLARHDLS